MSLQIIKVGLLASLVLLLTSCYSIFNKENQTIKIETTDKTEAIIKKMESKTNQHPNRLVRILEQDFSYKINNDSQQDTAFLKYNDNQNYSMYVLPDYELIVEEPTKDLLYFAKNKAISMRIELLSDDVDWNLVKRSTYSEFTSLYMANPIEMDLMDYSHESAIQEVHNGDDIITVYFINKSDLKLKLTMNTKTQEDHRDAFFQMAKTIMKENQPEK
jgi:hypothetical protein